ncbi:cytochrome-c peroxidase [Chitinophaga sp. Mgbs1]|uniref:Cytochrome-c peroxidase n=1 Tax=Chitinophaga solisilvae TaxID=1233460 RepID=A0A433WGQ0_9BACT|nr:cytochrome-c peroxidase [Chitinophaga solisilvae]
MKTRIIALLLTGLAAIHLYPALPTGHGEEAASLETYFRRQLQAVTDSLTRLQEAVSRQATPAIVRLHFSGSRLAYKKVEFLTEYYYPHLIRSINGPALPFADGENSKTILPPKGFQLIEEKIFSGEVPEDTAAVLTLTAELKSQLEEIGRQTDPYGFMDPYLFDAMRFEIYRIIALGISGYDSPVALLSVPEAAAALQGVQLGLDRYSKRLQDTALQRRTMLLFRSARQYLLQHRAFNTFDRLHFITVYANPLSTLLLHWQQQLQLTLPAERRILSPDAPHLFATAWLHPNGYTPAREADPTAEKIRLGARLFYDKALSGNGQRSCASCHQPDKAFTDGLPKSPSLDGSSTVARNAPTLLNVGFQSKLFYDSRAVFLERQVADVVHNKTEMDGSLQLAAAAFRKDTTYRRLFTDAFPGAHEAVNADNIANALSSYLRALNSLQSRFDQYMNGNPAALGSLEKKGFNVFMGKGKCGTCHFAPLFNGVAPPYFLEPESEVLGVPASDQPKSPLDKDPGKYILWQIPIQQYAFKTSGVRNSVLTAPYMHNGVFRTLEDVIDFYDKGGGEGLGIAPENQTLPKDKLQLNALEKKALIAFMQALTDTVSYKKY